MLERAEREDTIADWLADNDVTDNSQIAENLTEFNVTTDDLDMLSKMLRPEDRGAVIQWVNQVLVTERLVSEIQEASRRINSLVGSIKSYTHMDHAPIKQLTDIHTGLQTTLTLLNHKIKHNHVKLVVNFAPDLPKVNIFVGQMNQVWTNLLDNALDAMEGREGNELEVRSQRNREFVLVYIIDNGPGIPDDIQDKIFDPFFTTKPVGKGTGLGLQVVRQIISQHNGKVEVKSVPGRTEFKVCIPIS
jgi:signal transduction histidine kinase